MKRVGSPFLLIVAFLTSGCSFAIPVQGLPCSSLPSQTPGIVTQTPSLIGADTATPTSTLTATSTEGPSPNYTPTFTPSFTPTFTGTATQTFTPTYSFPTVVVNVANAACLFGPSKSYLWARDLHGGDTGVVWGRSPYNAWLYIKITRLDIPCWVSNYVVDVTGDVNRMMVQSIRLPITNALYAAPTGVTTTRRGDTVTVSWNAVWMTVDDDRGYFLEVWVCQGGNLVWTPVSLPDQYHTSTTFTDQAGCSSPSGGKLYTVEKHGYTDPVNIPWPPFVAPDTPTPETPTAVPLPTDTPEDTATPGS